VRTQLARIVGVAALGAALVLVPTAAGASVPATKNGCKYLKASEVTTVLGTPVKKGKPPVGPPTVQVCGYKVTGQAGQSVHLWVQHDGASATVFKEAKQLSASDVEPVTGLGPKAFYIGGGLNTAYVLQGGTLVYVQYVAFGEGAPDAATVKDDVTQLTKTVLGRI
jgi:hypothetical protein